MPPRIPPEDLARLRRAVQGAVDSDPSHLESRSGDASHLRQMPAAVVRPSSARDVSRLVRWARRARVALVPRGGGTSLDGESVPARGSVVVDLGEWTSPLEVDPVRRTARVGPGVINREIQRAAEALGLFFPPNPGSWLTSTIGGNVATNASGPRSFRYGPTRAWVQSVTAVLGTGETIVAGSSARKRSAGPDPVALLVGSEGTLGVFTEVVVRLAPLPARRSALVVPVSDGAGAVSLAQSIARLPNVAAIEYLDAASATALAREERRRLPSGVPLVLVELESTVASEVDDLTEAAARIRTAGVSADPAVLPDANEMWSLRGKSGAVLDREFGARVREDVAVPLDRLPALFDLIQEIAAAHRVPLWVYGHLGDGHLHPNFGTEPGGGTAARIRRELWNGVRSLDGTVSGEHGIGVLKRSAMRSEHPGAVLDWMRAVKQRCDPEGVMNPGKLYPPGIARSRRAPSPSRSGAAGAGTRRS